MNDIRQDLERSEREEYFAPNYERFAFETCDLIQTSGDADLGNFRNDVSNNKAKSAFADGAEDWE